MKTAYFLIKYYGTEKGIRIIYKYNNHPLECVFD